MKPWFALVVGVVFLGFVPVAAQNKAALFETPYFPLKVGHQWLYRDTNGTGDQVVLVKVDKLEYLEYKKGDRLPDGVKVQPEYIPCFRLEVLGGPRGEILAKRDDPKSSKALRFLNEHVAVMADGIYRFSGGGKDIIPPLRFFKLPLREGESWECNSLSDGTPVKGTFTSKADRVTVPAGSFDNCFMAIGAIQIGPRKMDVAYWFAQDVGIVKQHVKVGDFEMKLELERFVPEK